MALNIMLLCLAIRFNIRVYVRRSMSVVSILSRCVRLCNCRSRVLLSANRVLLTLSLLLSMLRKLNGSAGLLTLLSTLSKNFLRLLRSMFNCVRVIQP